MPISSASLARPSHGGALALRAWAERGADALERPAAADLGGGFQRLGRCRAGAALQRYQVQVAGQRVPEVGPLLLRVDPGDQVGREEHAAPSASVPPAGIVHGSERPLSASSADSTGTSARPAKPS